MKDLYTLSQQRKAVQKVESINDHETLRRIAHNASNLEVVMAAARKIRNVEGLTLAAINGFDATCREAARILGALGAEEACFRVALESHDTTARTTAVKSINDDALLERLVAECRHEDTQREALFRIWDQSVLARLTKTAPGAQLQERALWGLKDQAALAEIVASHPELPVRLAAVRKLAGPDALAALVSDKDVEIRLAAVNNKHMTDSALLSKIATRDESPDVRCAAVSREEMTDSALLTKIALEDESPAVRCAAVKNRHMTDSDALAKIALEDTSPDVRRATAHNHNLVDQSALAGIALDPLAELSDRLCAAKRLSDAEALYQIAGGTLPSTLSLDEARLRWTAALRLSHYDGTRAVGPLVSLMCRRDAMNQTLGQDLKAWTTEAVGFLERQYKNSADPDLRSAIFKVPNGFYGYKGPDRDCWHSDSQEVHFDLPR